MSDRYSNYTAGFNGSGLTFNQMGEAGLDMGQSFDEFIPSGALDRAAVNLNTSRPMARLRSRDLTTIFGVISPTVGYSCSSNSVFRYQQRAAGSTFTGSTNNVTVTSALGFLYPASLAAGSDNPAELQLTYCGLSSTGAGSDPPFVAANSVDFSGVTAPTHTSTFYLGPAYANGSALAGLLSASVDFGLDVSLYLSSGAVFPTECEVTRRAPRIRLTFVKADMIYTKTPNIFNTALPGTFAQYFRKATASSTRVADATTSHCKVSCTSGAYAPREVQVSGQDDALITYEIIPTSALSLSVASAIP